MWPIQCTFVSGYLRVWNGGLDFCILIFLPIFLYSLSFWSIILYSLSLFLPFILYSPFFLPIILCSLSFLSHFFLYSVLTHDFLFSKPIQTLIVYCAIIFIKPVRYLSVFSWCFTVDFCNLFLSYFQFF